MRKRTLHTDSRHYPRKPFLIPIILFIVGLTPAGSLFSREKTEPSPLSLEFYLLPLPFSRDAEASEQMMKKLFSAPILDKNMILDQSRRLENATKSAQSIRRAALVSSYCALPDETERNRLLTGAREKNHTAFVLFQKTQDNFEASLDSWMESRLENSPLIIKRKPSRKHGKFVQGRDFIIAGELDESRKLRKAVQSLEKERATALFQSWEKLFETLEDSDDADQSDCVKYSEKSIPPPQENLFPPLYLARFRYFNALPPAVRIEFILSFHRQ